MPIYKYKPGNQRIQEKLNKVQSASLLREITGSSAESETLVAGFKA
jgi:hypothetical protein